MSEKNAVNPAPVISLGILMLIGLFVEASVKMPAPVHAVFRVVWIALFGSLIVLSIVVAIQPDAKVFKETRPVRKSKSAEQPSLQDARTMLETFRKYQKTKH